MPGCLSIDQILGALKAAGESTRMRILMLLAEGELNVKDLTRILGQSQPRISRHLKLLSEAGLVERFREGSWMYFRFAEDHQAAGSLRVLLKNLDLNDPVLVRDRIRAETVKKERNELAQAYFKDNAAEWDRIRSLYVPEKQVESLMLEALGDGPFDVFVDLGTGTGRILELFAPKINKGIGIDINHDMLTFARSNLERAGLTQCQVRQGDLFHLPFDDEAADVVVLHQVLHFLSDPIRAMTEAERILKKGGKVLIVDFAPHDLEYLRDDYAHQRLGFSRETMKQWIENCGLSLGFQQDLKAPEAQTTEKTEAQKLVVSLWLGEKSVGKTGDKAGQQGADQIILNKMHRAGAVRSVS